jgi:glycine/D-amino acid oxidase-like deaminating enzyme
MSGSATQSYDLVVAGGGIVGAACSYFCAQAGFRVALVERDFPGKGHLAITDRYPGFLHHPLVELGYLKSAHSVTGDSVAFNIQPRKTGQILIGSSRQYRDEDSKIDQAMLTAMVQRASLYMAAIGSLNVPRVWTGFRAATPDKLPLIGPVSSDTTLWLATGYEGLGITTALATAELLVAEFTVRAPAIPPGPYLSDRFNQMHDQEITLQEML